MSARMMSTSKPAPSASARNTRSPNTSLVFADRPPLVGAVGATEVIRLALRGNLKLVELGDGLLPQRVRQLCVVVRSGEVLSVVQDVGQEVLQPLALVLVGLLGVGDDPRR